ncbi:WXG100 family type VII secretion target [Actinokineospora pegani]|uniref:WXG100 family type VII secretion target n=1 Tax=Actinokineospora pegani TaxID=2654637 RepID=UPI0012E9E36C|nr:WXG100 family type VII secretion target [Actinokineospora pegani]
MTFTVDPDQLRAHATRLAGHADALAALGGGLPGDLGGQPLGPLGQFLAAGLGNAMSETTAAFAHAAAIVDRVGLGARRTADDYERADSGEAATFTGIAP